jgi:PST family polysaccharide transporter
LKLVSKINQKVKNLLENPSYVKIIANMGWLLFDKVVRMGVGLFLGVWIARYLGPEQYGIWNYVLAFAAFFIAFADLGLDGVIGREIVKRPNITHIILGTAFYLRIISGTMAFLLSVVLLFFLSHKELFFVAIVSITSLSFILNSLDVIDYYFQSQTQSKIVVVSRNTAFAICCLLKLILLYFHLSLFWFVLVSTLEIGLSSVFLVFSYLKYVKHIPHGNSTSALLNGYSSKVYP